MEATPVLLRPGMNEGTDPTMLEVGSLRLLQNVRFRQLHRAEKRPGTVSLGTTGPLPTTGSALWVGEWGGLATACIESTSADHQSWRTVWVRDGSGAWNKCGRTGPVVPERRIGVTMDGGAALRGCTCVAINGVVYVAWAESGNIVHLTAMDPSGIVLRETELSSAQIPRLVYANSVLYLVYATGTTINIRSVTLLTLGLSAATPVATTLAAGADGFDAAPLEGATSWLLAYPEDATHIRTRVMSGTASLLDASILTTSQATFVSIAGAGTSVVSGGKVVVTYVDGTAAEVCTFTSALASASNVTLRTAAGNEAWTCQSGVVRTDEDEWHVVFGGSDESSAPVVQSWMLYHGRIDGTGAITDGMYKGYRFLPCSKPFTTGAAGSRKVSIVAHDAMVTGASLHSANHIIDLEPSGVIVGGGLQLSAISYEHQPTHSTAIRRHNTEVASLGTARLFCPIIWADPNDIAGIDALVFRSAAAADSVTWACRTVMDIDGALCVSGGALYEICSAGFNDLQYVCENGFANDPVIETAVAAGGAMTSGTDYTYAVTYAWLDPLGNRVHRSAPSALDTVQPSGGDLSVNVRIAGLGCTGRFGTTSGKVVAEVYRSWDGGPFYYVESTTTTIGSTTGLVVTDDAADATVEANRPLYTDSGILATDPPSGARLLTEGGSRVFVVGWRERQVQFTKIRIPTAPAEFVDDNAFRIFFREPLTALGYMDGALVAWSRKNIFVVTGDGPNDQGVGAYAEPRTLPAAVGADSPHVVEGPAGLFFYGGGTIWLLPRGFGAPEPVGDAIQATLSSYPYLRAAARCANAKDDCMHFVLAASDLPAAETKVAVWDNRLGGWSLDDIAGGVGAAGAVDGKFTWLLPTWDASGDKPARQFDVAELQDFSANGADTWIESRIGFGDWRPHGPIGWGVLRTIAALGEIAGACELNWTETVDGVEQTTKTFELEAGQFYIDHPHKRRKACAYRVDIYDSESSGMTAGMVVNALSFESQPEEGVRRNQERA